MAALFSKFITLVLLVLCSYSSLANEGQRVGFTIEENGTVVRQEALVQEGRVFIANPGGDPVTDLVYDSGRRELLIINHQSKSYYRIDDSVIQKAASMIESLSEVAETQQGVLSDLLGTLGLSGEDEKVEIRVVKTETILEAAGTKCQLIQQFREQALATELCIASRQSLSVLGNNYSTLESFYDFGDSLLSQASAILTNMGVTMPDLRRVQDEDGLPIMAYVWSSRTRVLLESISGASINPQKFALPQGYVQTPIPFIG